MQILCSRRSGGVSLIELLLALALLAVLVGMAAPDFTRVLGNQRAWSAANELHVALNYTRAEAIRLRSRVTLCPTSDGVQCAGDGLWEAGWMVFEDPNANAQLDALEAVLRVGPSLGQGVVARSNGPLRRYVSFLPTGAARSTGGALQIGSFRVCAGGQQRVLTVNVGGRVRASGSPACDL